MAVSARSAQRCLESPGGDLAEFSFLLVDHPDRRPGNRHFHTAGRTLSTLVQLQVSDDTFLELNPASEFLPAGITHFGIQVEDMESVRAMYEGRGANPTETRTSGSQALFSYLVDPQGVPIELAEYPPETSEPIP